MENNYIKVDSGMISNDIEKINSVLTDVVGQMETLKDEVSALNAKWQGDANVAFNRSMVQDMELAIALVRELADYDRALGEASKEYVSCENQVQDRILDISV